MRAARPGAVAACAAVLALGGCGGGGHQKASGGDHGRAEAGGEEAERDAAAARLRPQDRVAYYQLATTAGILRTEAALARRGRAGAGTSSDVALRAGRARIATLRPRDTALSALARPLAAAVDAFLRAPPGSARRSAAAPALVAATKVDAGLQRYLVRHRAQGQLVPD